MKQFIYGDGILAKVGKLNENRLEHPIYVINGGWDGWLSADGDQVRVEQNGSVFPFEIQWEGDELLTESGDYNADINAIEDQINGR